MPYVKYCMQDTRVYLAYSILRCARLYKIDKANDDRYDEYNI